MDKIAKQLHHNGLTVKDIELFLTWYKENKYNVNTLKHDILNSTNTLNFFRSKFPSKQHAFFILKHSLQQEIEQYVAVKHDMNCQLMTCPSLKRIIDALKYYKTLYNNNNKNSLIFGQLIIKYFEQKYKYVISDYHHILHSHLNEPKLIHIQNYEMINNIIYKKKLQCDMNKCQQYKRYNRNRKQTEYNESKNNNYNQDHKVLFYQDLMDTIHTYFIHGFDDGSRLKISALRSMNQTKPNYNQVTDESSIPFKDDNLKQLQKILSNQKNYLHKLRTEARMKYNKFSSVYGDDIEEKKENEKQINNCVGQHYYYWNYYKYNDWYVEKRYNNFKEEMLSNEIHNIDKNIFDYILYKATILIQQSDFISHIKSSINIQYGIEEDYKISTDIIMALIFYSDFDKLRYDFIQTFHKLNVSESDEQIKKRNAQFWFLSKTLLECVECYGTQLYDQKLQLFYTGFNKQNVLNDTGIMFCCPMSTSPHLEIATLYANENVVLLELSASNYSLKLFNCSFISSYALEDERLFYGGRKPLEIHSIINLNDNENYRVFMKAIKLFKKMICGKVLSNRQKTNVTNVDYFIIQCLSKHKMELNEMNGYKNMFPQCINGMFYNFCLDIKRIVIDLNNMECYYPGFSLICISEKCDNLVLFDRIAKLFVNCVTINVNLNGYGSITTNYLSLLVKILNKIDENKEGLLREIKLDHVEIKCNNNELEKYKSVLMTQQWECNVENKQKLCNVCLKKVS